MTLSPIPIPRDLLPVLGRLSKTRLGAGAVDEVAPIWSDGVTRSLAFRSEFQDAIHGIAAG